MHSTYHQSVMSLVSTTQINLHCKSHALEDISFFTCQTNSNGSEYLLRQMIHSRRNANYAAPIIGGTGLQLLHYSNDGHGGGGWGRQEAERKQRILQQVRNYRSRGTLSVIAVVIHFMHESIANHLRDQVNWGAAVNINVELRLSLCTHFRMRLLLILVFSSIDFTIFKLLEVLFWQERITVYISSVIIRPPMKMEHKVKQNGCAVSAMCQRVVLEFIKWTLELTLSFIFYTAINHRESVKNRMSDACSWL